MLLAAEIEPKIGRPVRGARQGEGCGMMARLCDEKSFAAIGVGAAHRDSESRDASRAYGEHRG
jgi:hypothetical protein